MKLTMYIFAAVLFGMIQITMAEAKSSIIVRATQLRTWDGQAYFTNDSPIDICKATSFKSTRVFLKGSEVEACRITRRYSKYGSENIDLYNGNCTDIKQKQRNCDYWR